MGMDRMYRMKAEKAEALSAFANCYETAVFREKLLKYFDPDGTDITSGQEIVLFGYIGMAGTVYLTENYEKELAKTLPFHFIRTGKALKEQAHCYPDPELLRKHGVKAVYPVEEGGLLTALCQLAAESRKGFRIDYEAVPVRQITIECCEVFDLNPWQLMSCGCTMMIADHGYEVVQALKSTGIPCQIIGYMTADQDKLICHDEIQSCLNRPEPDELLKVLK